MTITAAEVNKLRKQTGAGLMDCKRALQESNGDFEAAIDYLRKKGQKVSAKRADREAREGVVIAMVSSERKDGVALHLSCETDFVAKNEEFISFAKLLTKTALNQGFTVRDTLLDYSLDGVTVRERVMEMVGKIGEKIEVANFARLQGELVVPYIHMGYKIGVLVAMNKRGNDTIVNAAKDVAMQVAAMNPVAIDESDVPEDVKNHELEIGREIARNEGKPDHIIERIAEGKLQKFYKENTLLNQQFVKDSSLTVGKMLKQIDPELTITGFRRLSIG